MARTTGQKSDSKEAQVSGKPPAKSPEILLASNRQLQRRIFDFYTILELCRNLNSVLDINSLLNSFLSVLSSQIKVRKAAVFQRESRRAGKFLLTNRLDVEEFPPRSPLKENSEIVRALAGRMMAMTTGELLSAATDKNEKALLQIFDLGLVVPLHASWGMNGILFIGSKPDNAGFTNEDQEFLSLLSGQMAVALENARLYEAEKKAIAELQATQEQLVHTERLAALGEMSAKIAHEINNPLGIIKNYLMLLKKSIGGPADSTKYVEIVGEEIDRITMIVREMLQFHRPQNIDYKKINVLNVLEDVMTFLSPRFVQQKVKCTSQFSPDCPQVEASAENLKQVFINILLNAIDAMPGGGEVIVLAFKHEDNLVIQFQDTGPGVPEGILPKIFEPFFTTKEEGKGTGLGLAVCYGLVKKHNGNIEFKNTDKGGCVEIILTAADADNE